MASWSRHRLWSLMGPRSNPDSATCYLNDLGQLWSPYQSLSFPVCKMGFLCLSLRTTKDRVSYSSNSPLAQKEGPR